MNSSIKIKLVIVSNLYTQVEEVVAESSQMMKMISYWWQTQHPWTQPAEYTPYPSQPVTKFQVSLKLTHSALERIKMRSDTTILD